MRLFICGSYADASDHAVFSVATIKSSKSLDKKIRDRIDSMQIEDFASNPEVTIESSCFVHGKYDWIISFTAHDVRQAKKFCDVLSSAFPGIIESIDLLQTLCFVRKHHIFNPDRKKLSDLM